VSLLTGKFRGGQFDRRLVPHNLAPLDPVPMRKSPAIFVAACLALGACKRTPAAPPADPAPADPLLTLPDVITGFTAEPPQPEGGAVRRRYRRPGVDITVTLARLPMSPEQYAEWVKASVRSFPQATLDVGPSRGNGFYQCDEHQHCDLLIQLRSGVHLELRGGGTSSRDDVNAIARELPLRALAEDAAPGAPAAAVSFRRDIAPILASTCASSEGCHGAEPTHRVSLDLRQRAAYGSLVGHPSELRAGAFLVDPGHPAQSFMVDKLTHKLAPKGEGRPMPLDPQTGNALQPNPVEGFVWKTLVAWIAQGAADN
jgi:hypothetical protein